MNVADTSVKNEPYGGFDSVIFCARTLALAVLYVADLGLVRLGSFSSIFFCVYMICFVPFSLRWMRSAGL